MESGIRLEKVSFSYGKKKVLDDVSLSFEKHKLTCLLGSTGCGKTSMLRLIAGLEVPKQGEIFIDEHLVADKSGIKVPANERQVGMVFQDLALWPHFTVYKNIAWGLNIQKVKSTDEKVLDMLDHFEIRNLAERYPHELSGGQQQLVAIARSLVLEPKIMLFDEPLSNLDTNIKTTVMNYILDLKKQFTMTMVYVTHDHRDAEVLGDEVVELR